MIVDTNALSAAADDDTAIIAILGRADQMAIPVIVLGEYHFGIAPPRHRAMQENWLTCLPHHCVVLDVTEATTRYHLKYLSSQSARASQFPPMTSGSQLCAGSLSSAVEPRRPLRLGVGNEKDWVVSPSGCPYAL